MPIKPKRPGTRKPKAEVLPRKRQAALEPTELVDINDVELLRRFVTEYGKIIPARVRPRHRRHRPPAAPHQKRHPPRPQHGPPRLTKGHPNMSQQVILMDDVANLGKIGDTVHVRDGYARNYLLPKGLAEPVTKNALRKLDKIRKEREELLKIRRAEAQDKASKLRGQTLTIAVKAIEGDEEGKLYGSVTAADIAKALTEAGVAVDLEEPIKNLGTTDLTIALMAGVEVTLRLAIVAE